MTRVPPAAVTLLSRHQGVSAALAAFAAALVVVLPWYPGERPDVAPAYERYASAIVGGALPYDDFFVEYPPGALIPIIVPGLLPNGWYDPAFAILAAAALGAATGIGVHLAAGRVPRARAAVLCILFLLALGPIVVTRYDGFVALVVVIALALAARGRSTAAAAAARLGATMNLYPALLLPPLARAAGPRARAAVGAFLAAAAAVVLPVLVVGAGGIRASLEYQIGRPLHLESLGGSLLLGADALGIHDATLVFEAGAQAVTGSVARAVSLVQLGALLASLTLLFVCFSRRDRGNADLLDVAAGALAVLVALGSVLSPQFLVWLFPVAFVARGAVRVAAPLLLACLLTQILYPNLYDELIAAEPMPAMALVLRNLCLLAVAGALAWPWLRAVSRRGAGTA